MSNWNCVWVDKIDTCICHSAHLLVCCWGLFIRPFASLTTSFVTVFLYFWPKLTSFPLATPSFWLCFFLFSVYAFFFFCGFLWFWTLCAISERIVCLFCVARFIVIKKSPFCPRHVVCGKICLGQARAGSTPIIKAIYCMYVRRCFSWLSVSVSQSSSQHFCIWSRARRSKTLQMSIFAAANQPVDFCFVFMFVICTWLYVNDCVRFWCGFHSLGGKSLGGCVENLWPENNDVGHMSLPFLVLWCI